MTIPAQRQAVSRRPNRRRLVAGLTTLAATAGIACAAFSPSASASEPPPPATGSDWGQIGTGLGFGGSAIGCALAPTPWSCTSALGAGTTYFSKYGNAPMHGNPDMTQDGPLPAL